MLSDFELWHFVLNYWSIHDSNFTEKYFDTELAKLNIKFQEKDKYPDYIKDKIEKSWQKIFNISDPNKSIQANFWELNANDIIKIDKFIAK